VNPPRTWPLNRRGGMAGALPRSVAQTVKVHAAQALSQLAATRMNKRILPHQPGATRRREHFGAALRCFPCRDDPDRQQRSITSALVVDQRDIPQLAELFLDREVASALPYGEVKLVDPSKRAGVRRDSEVAVWWIALFKHGHILAPALRCRPSPRQVTPNLTQVAAFFQISEPNVYKS
jgi:hypothetical protein